MSAPARASWTIQADRKRPPAPCPPLTEPVRCCRCLRSVERATTLIGAHGFRQCSAVALCTAVSVKKTAIVGLAPIRDLATAAL